LSPAFSLIVDFTQLLFFPTLPPPPSHIRVPWFPNYSSLRSRLFRFFFPEFRTLSYFSLQILNRFGPFRCTAKLPGSVGAFCRLRESLFFSRSKLVFSLSLSLISFSFGLDDPIFFFWFDPFSIFGFTHVFSFPPLRSLFSYISP